MPENPGPEPAGRRAFVRRLFANERGLRAGWRLGIALAAYIAVALAVRLGLNALFGALFSAWNINASNAWRAPGWARTLFAWQGSLVTLAVNAAVIALCAALRKRLFDRRSALAGAGIEPGLEAWLAGTAAAALSAALFIALDSLRMERPLTQPNLTPGLIALWLISLAAALAGEMFTKAVLYDGLRGRWGAAWAAAVSILIFFLQNGGYAGNAVSAVNVLLMGAVCGLVYARYGLWASAGLRWGWSFAVAFLLGFGGGERAIYRLYGVSERLLTGGDAGFSYGLWLTIILVVAILCFERKSMMAFIRHMAKREP